MISYDSKTKVLSLQMGYQSQTGIAISQIAKIELKDLDPLEQQRIVAVSKLVVAFANGNNILLGAKKSSPNNSNPDQTGESMLDKATRILAPRPKGLGNNPSADTTTES